MSQLCKSVDLLYAIIGVLMLTQCSIVMADDSCHYVYKYNWILDFTPKEQTDSHQTPEVLFQTPDISLKECYTKCCLYENCSVVLYEEQLSTCHLINCDPPNTCGYKEKDGFTTVQVYKGAELDQSVIDEVEEEGMTVGEPDEEGMVEDEPEEEEEEGMVGSDVILTTISPTTTNVEPTTEDIKGAVHGSVAMTIRSSHSSSGDGGTEGMGVSMATPDNKTQTVIGDSGEVTDATNKQTLGVSSQGVHGITPTQVTNNQTQSSGTTNNQTQSSGTMNNQTQSSGTTNNQTQSGEKIQTNPVQSTVATDLVSDSNNSSNETTANFLTSKTSLQNNSQTVSPTHSSTVTPTVHPKITTPELSTNTKTTTNARTTEIETTTVMENIQTTTTQDEEDHTSTPETFTTQAATTTINPETTMRTTVEIATSAMVTDEPIETTEIGVGYNDTQIGHRIYDSTSTGALVAAMCFGILFVFAVMVVLGKRVYESYQRRHYSKMDYLINGMYN